MAYSRGQSNFAASVVDSRDGYRAQNEMRSDVGRQPAAVNIPVITASGPSRYSTAMYPGLRGGSGFDRDGPGRQRASPDFFSMQFIYCSNRE